MNIVLAMAQGLVVMLVAPFFSGLARVIRAKRHNRPRRPPPPDLQIKNRIPLWMLRA